MHGMPSGPEVGEFPDTGCLRGCILNVIGIGTDICEVERIAAMIRRHGDLFVGRIFTEGEIHYCGQHKFAEQHFAGRWAAKESVLKALGTGWARGIHWTDLEIHHGTGGRPQVRLHNSALDVAREQGIVSVLISISHSAGLATAFAIAVGGDGVSPEREAGF